ncbi:MAG: hypothetical protein ABIH04_10790 [Planctomycetota bacterium]
MGTEYRAKCRKCGRNFTVRTGGGFVFELLHCDRCGKERSITFEEIGEPHFRYARGLEETGCAVVHSKGYDEYVRKHHPVAPLSEEEYEKAVEKIAGRCRCGGRFRFDVPHRCPKCGSGDVEFISVAHYD